jgi:OTU domain-containing protein 5
MHSTIRSHCMDYIAKNADYFKQYMTEDVNRYISRKRQDNCHGNHIEIIAIAEIYNRPIEVYEYSVEPKNTFQGVFQTDNEPIRLSYHGRNHYNSVVDPFKATIGVGLGLPQMTPGVSFYLLFCCCNNHYFY